MFQVPAFESSDGKCITESNAIAYFVANAQLRGADELEKAQILQWLSFADSEILPASCTWVFPTLGIMQFNKQATERAKEDVKASLQVLNTHLLTKTYLVGERITLADVCVCCTLLHLYQYVLDPSFRKPYQNVNRWFTTIVNQPQVKSVIGNFKLCEKMAEFDPKKFAEVQGTVNQIN
ncbi:translation elongation factor activity protein [Homalodisca vitripennis]|nr:translation elongation factor activity protein [Homalodisca vitripennis]